MDINILQWIGYLASGIIALSMTMNSILKFRWINLAGALTFSTYGFLIGALPVGFLNAFIACVDIYYLYTIYSKKEVFEILEVRADNRYLLRFLKFHEKDIQKFFPDSSINQKLTPSAFLFCGIWPWQGFSWLTGKKTIAWWWGWIMYCRNTVISRTGNSFTSG